MSRNILDRRFAVKFGLCCNSPQMVPEELWSVCGEIDGYGKLDSEREVGL